MNRQAIMESVFAAVDEAFNEYLDQLEEDVDGKDESTSEYRIDARINAERYKAILTHVLHSLSLNLRGVKDV